MSGNAQAEFRANLIRYGGDVYPEIIERAQGCYVFDASGKKILDFTSGQMCATVGHSHPNVVAAIKKSCDTALHLFSGMIPRSVVQLAEKLAQIVPKPLRKSLLLSTGSESNEAALKMANIAYEAGATTTLEVIDAERRARDAETGAVIAEDASRRARLDLLSSTGHLP